VKGEVGGTWKPRECREQGEGDKRAAVGRREEAAWNR